MITDYVERETPVVSRETFEYGRTPVHNQITKIRKLGSSGTDKTISYKYPQDLLSLTGSAEVARLKLVNNHQMDVILSQSSQENNSITTVSTDYKVEGSTNLVLPSLSKTSISGSAEEGRDVFHKYDSKGNLLSFSKLYGPKTNYIYGYKGQYPVAEVKNVDYSVIESLIGSQKLQALLDNVNSDQASISNLLLPLKALPNVFVEFYSYIPSVGIASITDSKGLKTTYQYDEHMRLKYIIDSNGHIVQSFNYHYKD